MADTEVKPLVVTVLGNSEGELCRGGWGPRRSSAETTEFTRAYLGRLYGDRVRIEYLDAARPALPSRSLSRDSRHIRPHRHPCPWGSPPCPRALPP